MRKYLTGLLAFMLAAVLILCTGVSAQAMTVSYVPNSTRLSKGISVMKSSSAERNKLENAINAVVNTPLSVQSESEIQNAIISAIDSAVGRCGASNCWSSSNTDYKVYIYQSEYTKQPKNGAVSDPSTADGVYSFSVVLKWQQETDLAGLFSEKYAEYIPWITNKSNPSAAEVFTVAIKAKSYCETVGQNCIFEETTIVDASATCTEDGSGHTIKTCAVCGRVENGENVVIPATGHIEGEWVLASEDIRPCNETGSETWDLYCTVCGELIENEVLETSTEHVIIPATCTEPEVCAVCREIFGAALGHKKDAYTVITAPGCETDGLIGFYCSECGEYVTETVPALGHVPGDDYREGSKSEMQNLYNEYMGIKIASAAPMSSARVIIDDNTYYCYHCEYCGEVEMGKVCNHNNTTETFYKVTAYNSDKTPVLGAVSTDVEKDRCSTDVARILVCNDCNETVFTNILAKHDHEYALYLGTAATCATASDVECRQKKCVYCGGTKTLTAAERVSVSGEYNMANHDKKSMVNQTSVNGVSLLLVAGDCQTPSVYLTVCSRCKGLITEARVNEARAQYLAGKKVEVWYKYEDHTWTDDERVEATCEHSGYTTQICSVCGEAGKTSYQSITAHAYEVDNSSAAWTLDENGMPVDVTVDLICTSCSHKVNTSTLMVREIADAYIAPTCSTPGTRTFIARVLAEFDSYVFRIDVTLPADPEAHVFSAYISDDNATCTTNCTETAECSLCHEKMTREIENTALGHNEITSYIDEVAATCSTEGSRVKVVSCDRCNEELSRETETLDINPKNHMGEPVIDEAVPATCTAEGLTGGCHYECCGKVIAEQETVPALGHDPRESETGNLRNGAFDETGHFITTNCVTDGSYDTIYVCDRCGETLRAETVQVKANGPHAYAISYYDDIDGMICTAAAECQNEGCSSVITENSQLELTIEERPTCSGDAIGHYTATFANELFSTWRSSSVYIPGTALGHIWNADFHMSADYTSGTCTFRCERHFDSTDDECRTLITLDCIVSVETVQEPVDCATEKTVKYVVTFAEDWAKPYGRTFFPEGRGTGEFGAHAVSGEPELGSVVNGAFNEAGEFITSNCVTDGSYELVYRCSVPGCHKNNPVLHTTLVQVAANGPHVNTEVRTRTVTEATKTSNRWEQNYTICLDCGTELETGEPYEVEGTQLPDHVHTWTTYYTYGSDCRVKGDTRRKCSDTNCPDHADELVSSGTGYYGVHYYSGDIFYTSGSDCRHYGDKCQYCYFCHSAYIVIESGAGYRGSHTGGTYTGNPTYSNITSAQHTVTVTTYCNTCGDSLGSSSSTVNHSFAGQSCTNGGVCVCGKSGQPGQHEYGDYEISSALISPATCTSYAKYYESCKNCGEIGNGTFTGNEFGPHSLSSGYEHCYPCQKAHYCTNSGCDYHDTPIASSSHDYADESARKGKNCVTLGKTITCICGKKTLEGTYGSCPGTTISDKDYTRDVYYSNNQHKCYYYTVTKCSLCKKQVSKSSSESYDIVNCSYTGPNTTRYGDADSRQHGVYIENTCQYCHHTNRISTGTANHSISSRVTNATSSGHEITKTCSVCGWKESTVAAHTYNSKGVCTVSGCGWSRRASVSSIVIDDSSLAVLGKTTCDEIDTVSGGAISLSDESDTTDEFTTDTSDIAGNDIEAVYDENVSEDTAAESDVETPEDVREEILAADDILPAEVLKETGASSVEEPLSAGEELEEVIESAEEVSEPVEENMIAEEEMPVLETEIISEPAA